MNEYDLSDEKMELFVSAVKETLNWCEGNKHHSTVKIKPQDQIDLLQLVLVLVDERKVKNDRIEQLEKALEFYANQENYLLQGGSTSGVYTEIQVDAGSAARQSLGKEE